MTSIYVQLAPYLLLEYSYGDSSSTYVSSQVKLARLFNEYTGQDQFLNTSPYQNITQNVLDTSAANIGGYKWAYLDKDVPTPYINIDPKLTYTDLSSTLPSLTVLYDRVRLHILSGYNLEDIQGLIAQVYVREAQSGKTSIFANNVFLKSESSQRQVLNPRPFFLGDRVYDKYIEFLVPSLKAANDDFYTNPTNPISIGYQYSSDNHGFLINSQIYVKVFEINRTEKKNAITYLYTSANYEVNVNQQDQYSLLSASIQEASDGDYFIYYPTYNGDFILDFIANMNAQGGDYAVINDIDVYEQVGMEQVVTSSFSQIQTAGFDGPLTFRPILKYADVALSFSVDYTVRIYNKENGFQLIRRASTTSYYPRKYGKNLERIQLAQQSYPFKVYNKVFNGQTANFIGDEYTSNFSTVYVPVFYETRNIVTQVKSLLPNGANPVSPDFIGSVIYGQGDARIYLSEFESYFKFSIYQVNSAGSTVPLDLSASNLVIAFKDSTGKMIKIPAQDSTDESTKSSGQVIFKLPNNLSQKVLYDTNVHPFYILSEPEGAAETLIYSGSVDRIGNVSKELARVKDLVSTTLTTTGTSSSAATTTATTTSTPGKAGTLSTKATTVIDDEKNTSLIKQLTVKNSESLSNLDKSNIVKPIYIPGYTNDTNAASVKTGVKPVSSKNTPEVQVSSTLSQTSGKEIKTTDQGS